MKLLLSTYLPYETFAWTHIPDTDSYSDKDWIKQNFDLSKQALLDYWHR